MSYIIITLFISAFLWMYLALAKRFNIIDIPNERSSHKYAIIRGGGIIFPVAFLLWFVFFNANILTVLAGVLLISLIGFLDDLFKLPALPKLAVQSLSALLIIWELTSLDNNWLVLIILLVVIVGWVNAFNFMDGINSMLVMYSMILVIALYLVNIQLQYIPTSLINILGLSLIVFSLVNIRDKALCFAGDVGSLSLGLIFAYIIGLVIWESGEISYMLFLAVYGIDTSFTLSRRIIRRENIFEPHRRHLYQLLANEMNITHWKVASVYAVVQMSINLLVIYLVNRASSILLIWSIPVIVLIAYLIIRFRISKKLSQNPKQEEKYSLKN